MEAGTKRQGVPANVYTSVPYDLRVACVCVADFVKRSSPAALDVAFTVGHDRVPAHGSTAMALAMASSNAGRWWSTTGGRVVEIWAATAAGGGWPAARLALPLHCVESVHCRTPRADVHLRADVKCKCKSEAAGVYELRLVAAAGAGRGCGR